MAEPAVIREAVAADAAAVRDLLVKTWHDTYDELMGTEKVTEITSRWHAKDVLCAQIEDAGNTFLIAEQGGHSVGHAYAYEDGLGCLFLSRLYILPDAQGVGLGRALFDAVIAGAPGAKCVRLEVHPGQVQARRFYEANGFRVIGETGSCGSDSDQPALVMEKQL